MTTGERIKKARKDAGLTQQALADQAGLKQGTVAGYETDRSIPSDRSFSDIARACSVDEHWLRTGDGSPELQLTEAEEIERFVSEALADKNDDIRRRFLIAFSRLDADGWKAVATLVRQLTE